MEGFVLLYIVVTLMLSAGANGESYSMSCSMVNGKQICESQQNQGNMASSSSQAVSGGPTGDYMNSYAGAGNPNDWSSSQSQQGVAPPAGSFPGFGFGGFGFPNFGGGFGSTGGGAPSSSQSFSSSSGSGAENQGASGESGNQGASGGPGNQGGYQSTGSFGPGTFTYTGTGGGNAGGGAFASAGGFAGAFPGPMPMNPANFNPFAFVFGRR